MDDHDPNQHHELTEASDLDRVFQAMSLAQLQTAIDGELLAEAVADILTIAPEKRAAAIADFAEIDPLLASKLHVAVSFALS